MLSLEHLPAHFRAARPHVGVLHRVVVPEHVQPVGLEVHWFTLQVLLKEFLVEDDCSWF